MEVVPQLVLILVLILLNGFFVASEFALVAVRKTRIDELAKKNNKAAKRVQESLGQLSTFISSTQLGVTLASLAIGWLGEPVVAKLLEPLLRQIMPIRLSLISAHVVAIIGALLLITFFQVVIGELVPKSIALQKTERLSLLIITPMTLFTNTFKPFIWVLNYTGGFVMRLLGFSPASGQEQAYSEEEIKMILAQSAREGALEKDEVEMVYSALKLGDIPVRRIMIPRGKIIAFEKQASIEKIVAVTQKYPHSRFPVYNRTIDEVIGFVHIKDIYRDIIGEKRLLSMKDLYKNFLRRHGGQTLSKLHILRKIPRVRENARIDDVLVLLRKKRVHIAVVEDDHGRTVGLAALEDIVESLVGEIRDEFDTLENEVTHR